MRIKKRKTVKVIGPTLGEWGKEKYGLKPASVDALEYYPAYLDHLRGQIHEAQAASRDTVVPCAFVTFK